MFEVRKIVIFEIVILAMIAAFLGLRLYSVLGRRAEGEEEVVPRQLNSADGDVGAPPAINARVPMPVRKPADGDAGAPGAIVPTALVPAGTR